MAPVWGGRLRRVDVNNLIEKQRPEQVARVLGMAMAGGDNSKWSQHQGKATGSRVFAFTRNSQRVSEFQWL